MTEINGQNYQHATVKVVATATGGTFPLKTFSKVNYTYKAPKKRTNDAEGKTDGFTIDKEDIDASISMKLSEWIRFRAFLIANANGLGALQAQFDLPVSFGITIAALKTDTLRGVMINEEPRTSEDGQEVLMVDIPLFVMKVDFADGPALVYEL